MQSVAFSMTYYSAKKTSHITSLPYPVPCGLYRPLLGHQFLIFMQERYCTSKDNFRLSLQVLGAEPVRAFQMAQAMTDQRSISSFGNLSNILRVNSRKSEA